MEKLLTVEEVAPLIGFSAWNVRKLCRLRVMPHMKVGGQFRFDLKIVEEWVKTQHEKSTVVTEPVVCRKIKVAM